MVINSPEFQLVDGERIINPEENRRSRTIEDPE